jgi:RHS repeat-associated protein
MYNADSGLYLAERRAYDPATGRWLSRDPIGEIGDTYGNVYVYVGGDPLNRRDPLGLWTVNVGFSGSINVPLIGPVGGGAGGFYGVVCDGTQCATYSGTDYGVGAGAGGSAGVQFGGSNARRVCDLSGPFLFGAASAGEGDVVGVEGYHGNGVTGFNLFEGVGGGTPVSATGGVSTTTIQPW